MTDIKANCFIRRLKKNGRLEVDYHEHSVEISHDNCESIIDETTKIVIKRLVKDFEMGAYTNVVSLCLAADNRTEALVDDLLLYTVHEYDTTTPENVKETILEELSEKARKAAQISIMSCLVEMKFGMLYDSCASHVSRTDEELIADYCERKYVVDHDLFAPEAYEIVLNPNEIKITEVDCASLVKAKLDELMEFLEHTLSRSELKFDLLQLKCAMKKNREGKLAERVLAAMVSTNIGLSKELQARERKKLIKFLADVLTDMEVCDH